MWQSPLRPRRTSGPCRSNSCSRKRESVAAQDVVTPSEFSVLHSIGFGPAMKNQLGRKPPVRLRCRRGRARKRDRPAGSTTHRSGRGIDRTRWVFGRHRDDPNVGTLRRVSGCALHEGRGDRTSALGRTGPPDSSQASARMRGWGRSPQLNGEHGAALHGEHGHGDALHNLTLRPAPSSLKLQPPRSEALSCGERPLPWPRSEALSCGERPLPCSEIETAERIVVQLRRPSRRTHRRLGSTGNRSAFASASALLRRIGSTANPASDPVHDILICSGSIRCVLGDRLDEGMSVIGSPAGVDPQVVQPVQRRLVLEHEAVESIEPVLVDRAEAGIRVLPFQPVPSRHRVASCDRFARGHDRIDSEARRRTAKTPVPGKRVRRTPCTTSKGDR